MQQDTWTSDDVVGYLTFRVSTAQGAVPLEGAHVVIRTTADRGDQIVATLISDRSGATPAVALPTRPRELSETPGNEHPFEIYHADVSKSGFFTHHYQNIPVFEGISAVQAAEMIPLPQNGFAGGLRPDDDRTIEGEDPDL